MAVDASDPSISIPVGITIGLIASFIQSLGLTVQRKSHVLNQALPDAQQRVEHRRPLWLLGFAIFISSNLFGSLFQIASLPVVILAPLGAVSLLWNAVFARILLGDVFSPWMILGTLLIAGGAVLIAVFGIVPEPTHSLEDLLRLFNRPAFIAYFSLLGFVVLVWLAVTHLVEYSYTRRFKPTDISPPLSPLVVPTAAPSILTTATTASHALDPTSPTERTPLIDRKPQPRSKSPSPSSSIRSMITSPLSYTARSLRTPLFLASSYASISGIVSGMCLLFAKSGVELLLLTLSGHNQFWRWQAWVLLLSLVVFALLQLWYMHKSLVLADPTLVCPLAFCFYNLSSIVNGLVYFNQFSMLSTMHLLLVLLGIAILLGGVWVVSFPPEGGPGVDIGAWSEGEPPTEMVVTGEESDQEAETYEDEPLPMEGTAESIRGRPQAHIGLGLGLSVITEPPAAISPPQLSPRSPSPPRSRLRTLLARAHSRQQTDSALLASPLRRSRSTYTGSTGPELATTSDATGRRHRRMTLEAGSAFSPSPHALSSPPAPNIGGFSIGLSPISPGFSLVPERRRRQTAAAGVGSSAVGGNGGGSGGGAYGGGGGGHASDTASVARLSPRMGLMRRVVSEGDAEGRERRTGGAGAGVARAGESRLSYGTDAVGASAVRDPEAPAEQQQAIQAARRQAKGRWKWLQGLLSPLNERDS